MMRLIGFTLGEYVGFSMILFLLVTLDAVLTNLVARAAGKEYYRVKALPWVKWAYKRVSFGLALVIHFLMNFFLTVLMILLPVKAGYLLFFIGIFFLRVWSIGYKAYIYSRGYI